MSADELKGTVPKKEKKRTVKVIKKFPSYSIVEALKLSTLIKENNGGNPWDSEQLALALGLKSKGNIFYYLTAASRDYGFTSGTRETARVELNSLGRQYVYAQSDDEMKDAIKKAFNNIDIFKRVYDYYKGNEPTDETFFRNALVATFGIDEALHDDFIKVYNENKILLNKFESKGESTKKGDEISKEKTQNYNKESVFTTENGNKIFVIMPFSEKTGKYSTGFFKEVFNQLIVPSAKQAGYIAETADRNGSDIIHATIIKAISNSEIILADLTEHNPNVLFELGIAIALKKPVILIKTEETGQIFDIDNTIRVFSYKSNLWNSTLKSDIPNLSSKIEAVVRNISIDKSYFDTFLGE